MVHYVMLRGIDRFQSEYNTFPGVFDDQVEPDIGKLKVDILYCRIYIALRLVCVVSIVWCKITSFDFFSP